MADQPPTEPTEYTFTIAGSTSTSDVLSLIRSITAELTAESELAESQGMRHFQETMEIQLGISQYEEWEVLSRRVDRLARFLSNVEVLLNWSEVGDMEIAALHLVKQFAISQLMEYFDYINTSQELPFEQIDQLKPTQLISVIKIITFVLSIAADEIHEGQNTEAIKEFDRVVQWAQSMGDKLLSIRINAPSLLTEFSATGIGPSQLPALRKLPVVILGLTTSLTWLASRADLTFAGANGKGYPPALVFRFLELISGLTPEDGDTESVYIIHNLWNLCTNMCLLGIPLNGPLEIAVCRVAKGYLALNGKDKLIDEVLKTIQIGDANTASILLRESLIGNSVLDPEDLGVEA